MNNLKADMISNNKPKNLPNMEFKFAVIEWKWER